MNKDYRLRLSDGEELDVTAYGVEQVGVGSCVVYVHGFKGFKDWGFVPYVGEYFSSRGYFTLTFNFSHNGISPGTTDFNELDKFAANTFSREVRELSELIDEYRNGSFGIPNSPRIGLIGHSRGGATALLVACSKPEVGAVVTWSSVSHLDRYSPQQKALWREQGYLEVINQRTKQVMKVGVALLDEVERHRDDKLSVAKAVAGLKRPLLVIHGEQDESVPVTEAAEISNWAGAGGSEVYIVPGRGHTFGIAHPFVGSNQDFEAVLKRSESFLRSHLG